MIDASGVVDVYGGHLKVSEHLTALKVIVAMGSAFLRKPDGSMVYPVNLEIEDAEVDVTTNASGNPRIDAVVLYQDLNETANTDATNVAKFEIVEGLPAASPQAPSDSAIESAIGAANPYVRLANIRVENGASTIDAEDVEDTRERFGIANQFDSAEVGDLKVTTRPAVSGRWLPMIGETIGAVGSGADYEGDQYKALFDHLNANFDTTPTDTWENLGELTLKDTRDRFPMSAGSAYGLGETGGVNEITVADHAHTMAHTHSISHTHQIDPPNTNTSTTGSHTHTIGHEHYVTRVNDGSYYSNAGDGLDSGGNYAGITMSGSQTNTNSGSSGSHYHSVDIAAFTSGGASTSTSGGSSAANTGSTGGFTKSVVNKYFAVNYFIRY